MRHNQIGLLTKTIQICCEGRCFDSFHQECLNLTEAPENFVCEVCAAGEAICGFCGKRGQSRDVGKQEICGQ